MKKFSKYLIVAFLLCFANAVVAQNSPAPERSMEPSGKPAWQSAADYITQNDSFRALDTSMNGMNVPDKFYLSNIGNFGSLVIPVLPRYLFHSGFNEGFNQWDPYMVTFDNMRLYRTLTACADFRYTQGPHDLQNVNGSFTQNIRPYWNYSVAFNSLKAPGGYLNSRVARNQFIANTWYYSRSRKYRIVGAVLSNSFYQKENGGIADTTSFSNFTVFEKEHTTVNLSDGAQLWKSREFVVHQTLFFGPKIFTQKSDSDSVKSFVIIPRFFFSHEGLVSLRSYGYGGSDTAYFAHYYFNDASTGDTLKTTSFSNKVSVGTNLLFLPNDSFHRKPLLTAEVFSRYVLGNLKMQGLDTIYHRQSFYNTSVGASVYMHSHFHPMVGVEYWLSGHNQGDYNINGNLSYSTSFKYLPFLSATLFLNNVSPSIAQQQLLSNHFHWNNSFQKSTIEGISLVAKDSSGAATGVDVYSIDKLIYLGNDTLYHQSTNATKFIRMYAEKEFIFFTKLHFYNKLIYQHISGSAQLLRMPDLRWKSSLFVQGFVFKHAMLARAGVDYNFINGYLSYGYMPGLSDFYLQNSFVLPSAHVIDLWLAARVKRFQAFVRYEQIQQLLFKAQNYHLPFYPYEPNNLKLGIRWIFYN